MRDVKLAEERVKRRVSEGGHNIPQAVIQRRYLAGIRNFLDIYLQVCDNIILLDNSGNTPNFVMQQVTGESPVILYPDLYRQIKLAANE